MTLYIMVGYPASGKSSYAKKIKNAVILSRDLVGGQISNMVNSVEQLMLKGKDIVLDNTNLTACIRQPFIELATQHDYKTVAIFIDTTIEDCQIRHLRRMMQTYGQIFQDGYAKNIKDPNIYPPAVLFSARKQLQIPSISEGFHCIKTKVPAIRWNKIQYKNRAVFFDIDGTLRQTEHLPLKYPTNISQVKAYADKSLMLQILDDFRTQGFQFFGISNQSGIYYGKVSSKQVLQCMEATKNMLDLQDLEIQICPHKPNPIQCFCRKPQVGMVVYFAEKYFLDLSQCLLVGDQTTDKTLAKRLRIQFIHSQDFWQ